MKLSLTGVLLGVAVMLLAVDASGQTAPSILTQPTSQISAQGGPVTFSVTATGTLPLFYQWRKEGANITGATAANYTIATATTNHVGNYMVYIFNSYGAVTSTVATLTVIVPPAITAHPRSFNTNIGATVVFSVAASGTAPLTYQWRKDGANIPNANLNAFTLTRVQVADAGIYTVQVSNPAGSATSSNAVLNVGTAPIITGQPQFINAALSQTVSFSVTATGTPLNYQWRKSSTPIAGATNATLILTNITVSDFGSYNVVVSNFLGAPSSMSVSLNQIFLPGITMQPQGRTVSPGSNFTMSVQATGTAPLHFQWLKDGTNLPGAISPSYYVNNTQTNQSGNYTVGITNLYGAVTSSVATVLVLAPPVFTLQPLSRNTNVGATVTFSAAATGMQPISFQWRKDGVDIPNATFSAFTLGNVQPGDTGSYSLYASNPAGRASSSNAVLNVGSTPVIIEQPASLTVAQGQSASFTVGATGVPLNFFWRKNGVNIPSATNASYIIPSTLGSDAGSYSVIVSNFLGVRPSAIAVLTVTVPVSITVQPASRIAGEGSNTTFTVTTTGTSPRFQWYKNRTQITGATGSSYSINRVGFSDAADYTVVVTNILNAVTSQVATLTVERYPPAITDQPVSQSKPVGGSVTFTVTATGTTLNYQWQKDDTNILDATAADLSLTNITLADAGGYRVLITNPVGSVTSIVATLTVGYAPTIVRQPASLAVPVGSNASFNVEASGTDPLSYQWNKRIDALLDQTNSTLLLNAVTAHDAGAFTVVVSSPFGFVTSSVATLMVQFPPQITQQPIGGLRPVGSNITFSVTATGAEPLIYQWQKDGLDIPDATATNYMGTTLTLADSGAYTVVVTNFLGSVTSSIATLTVGYPPLVVEPPQSSTNLLGRTVVLSCTVTGTLPMNLQWFFNGAPLVGETNSTLTLTSLQSANAGYYALSATNAFGGTVSPTAQLSIFETGGAAATWTITGALATPRARHTETLLSDGKVLVAGGSDGTNNLSGTELYDPATGTWTATGTMNSERGYGHTATLLPNGKILVSGGSDGTNSLASVELYDPATGTWMATSNSLATARYRHTATLLPNGKVLVAGGWESNYLSSAELYDPVSGIWTTTGAMNSPRAMHTATLLPNGKVLVAGGWIISSAELYDPATGTWTVTSSMTTTRSDHTATLLSNGKVLVAGGYDSGANISSAELYDPASGTWMATGSLQTARQNHTATLLSNGKVLVAGGYDHHTWTSVSMAELFDPATGTWMATSNSLATARLGHTATLLPDGNVLVAGGYYADDNTSTYFYLSSAELYESSQATVSVTLGNLSQIYDGTAKSVSVTTIPPGLPVDVTYNGSANAPTNAGSYTVIGTINDPYYQGSATNMLVIYPAAITLTGATTLANGTFQFNFTSTPGALFDVLATTNLSLPLTNWTVLGGATAISPGWYQFTDPQATNHPQRFYCVRSP